MGRINLDGLKPGMVLAANVIERGGRVLLGAGVAITEKHIDIFRKWGVTEADIENTTQEEVANVASAQLDPEILKEAERMTGKVFQVSGHGEAVMDELYRLCVLRQARQLSRGKSA